MLLPDVLLEFPTRPVALDFVTERSAPGLDPLISVVGAKLYTTSHSLKTPPSRSIRRTRLSAMTFQKSGRW